MGSVRLTPQDIQHIVCFGEPVRSISSARVAKLKHILFDRGIITTEGGGSLVVNLDFEGVDVRRLPLSVQPSFLAECYLVRNPKRALSQELAV